MYKIPVDIDKEDEQILRVGLMEELGAISLYE